MEALIHPLLNDPKFIAAAVSGLFFIVILAFWLRRLNKHKFERQIRRLVKKVAVDYRQDIYLPDGLGETVYINYLALTHYGILVLNVQNYPGILFGGENVDLWTQVDNHKSYKFDNPLPYSEICATSVKQIVPGVPVHNLILFTNAGSFPKGKPEGVRLPGEFPDWLNTLEQLNVIPVSLQDAWDRLMASNARLSTANPTIVHGRTAQPIKG